MLKMTPLKKLNILHIFHRLFRRQKVKYIKQCLTKCDTNVYIPYDIRLFGYNVSIDNDVSLGSNMCIMCDRAPVVIKDHVMFGPNVTLVTGNHRIDVIGKYMTEIRNEDKLPENDEPIIFEGDNWVGANAIILKGVTVGRGSVIGAGAVVTKDVPPYSIYVGVPNQKMFERFTKEQIEEHEAILAKTNKDRSIS